MESERVRKEYGCRRAQDVKAWGRNKEALCWLNVDMKYHAMVEAFSMHLDATRGCNLNYVSSDAMKPYMKLKEKTDVQKAVKNHVLEMLIGAIKTNINPFTKQEFDEYGITDLVVQQMINYCRTGNPALSSIARSIMLRRSDLSIIDTLFGAEIRRTKIKAEADDAPGAQKYLSNLMSLHRRLLNDRARALLGGRA